MNMKKLLGILIFCGFMLCTTEVNAECYHVTNPSYNPYYSLTCPSESDVSCESVHMKYCCEAGVVVDPGIPGFNIPEINIFGYDLPTLVSGANQAILDGYCNLVIASAEKNYGKDVNALEKGNSTVSCGSVTDIPKIVPTAISIIYTIIRIVVPIGLIIFGMIDMTKAVTGQKEDEIKKGQQTFIKRCIAAAIIFFVFSIVKLVVSAINDENDVVDCMNCFLDSDTCTAGYDAESGNQVEE